jgi:hypothetical protein
MQRAQRDVGQVADGRGHDKQRPLRIMLVRRRIARRARAGAKEALKEEVNGNSWQKIRAQAATRPTTKQKGDAAEDARAAPPARPRACGWWRAIIGRPGAAAAKST